MLAIGIIIILLLILIGIEISGITTNTHSTNKYLNDIKDELNEITEYIRNKETKKD